MAYNRKTNVKLIEELLESDDELPDSCNENPEIPSYANDERFDKLRFDWIYNKEIPEITSNVPKNDIDTIEGSERNFDESLNINNGIAKKRVLKKNDIYCLQSVQNHLSRNVLEWFADFLMSKDIQLKYKLNKGCLVYEYTINEFKQHEHSTVNIKSNQKSRFKIIVRKWFNL